MEDDEAVTFEYKNEDDIDESLLCNICQLPYSDPEVIEGCGHTVCKECIDLYVMTQTQRCCPVCRQEIVSRTRCTPTSHREWLNMIEKLPVVCSAPRCSWEGPRHTFRDHLRIEHPMAYQATQKCDSDVTHSSSSSSSSSCEEQPCEESQSDDSIDDMFAGYAACDSDGSDASDDDLWNAVGADDDNKDAITDDEPAEETQHEQCVEPTRCVNDDEFGMYDAPLAADEAKAFEMASSSQYRDAEHIVYYDPLRALMPNNERTLFREDIPQLRNPTNDEIRRELNCERAVERHKGIYPKLYDTFADRKPRRHQGMRFVASDGSVANMSKRLYHMFSSFGDELRFLNGMWLVDTFQKKIGTLYVLDAGFVNPLPFFQYDCTSVREGVGGSRITTVSNVGVEGQAVKHKIELRRVLASNISVASARPIPWCRQAWSLIVDHFWNAATFPDASKDELLLDPRFFADEYEHMRLSEVFFDVIERNLCSVHFDSTQARALSLIRNSRVYCKYFFHDELEFLAEWYSSSESLLSLKPRALYALWHVLHDDGDQVTKRVLYRYLFVRDDQTLGAMLEELERSNMMPSRVFRRIAKERDMKASSLFQCSTFRCRWELPLFSASTFQVLRGGLHLPRAFFNDEARHRRFALAMTLKNNFETFCNRDTGSVAVSWSRVKRWSGFREASKLDDAVAELTQNSQSMAKVRTGKADDDLMLVEHWRVCYAEALYNAVREAIAYYMLDKHDPPPDSFHESDMRRVYRFPEPHPISDPSRRFPSKHTLAAEQLRCVRALEHVPFYLTVGGPGTGKTEVMRAVVQCYHPDAVIGTALQNATVRMLASRVTDRVLTLNRLLYWHSICCLWRTNVTEKRHTKKFLQSCVNPFKGEEYRRDPARKHLSEGEYYSKHLNTTFCHCPLENIKLVIFDEASMCNTEDVISMFVVFLRCCRKPPKILICGDTMQLLPIGSGNLLSDLTGAFDWCMSRFTKNFRFGPCSITRRNAEAIRTGAFESIECDLISKHTEIAIGDHEDNDADDDPEFGSLRRQRKRQRAQLNYAPNKALLDGKLFPEHECHWIEMPEARRADKGYLRDLLSSVIDYLLEHDTSFMLHEISEPPQIQCICPTNALCRVMFELIEQKVFLPQADERHCLLTRRPDFDDTRPRLYEGQKIKYGRNVYPIGLCNNLPLIIQRIEIVKIPKEQRNDSDMEERTRRLVREELGGDEDDLATVSASTGKSAGKDARLGNANAGSNLDEILKEFDLYAKAKKWVGPMYPGSNVFTTLCKTPQLNFTERKTHKIGFRIIADPITNVTAGGTTRDSSKTVMIPWTPHHIAHIHPATAVTVHSAIGTETDTTFVFLPYYFEKHTTRQLAIVATSRSKKRSVIVSNERTFKQTLENIDASRQTFLGAYLRYKLEQHFASRRVPLQRPADTPEIRRIALSEMDEQRETERQLADLRERQERERQKKAVAERRRKQRKSAGINLSLLNSLSAKHRPRKRATPSD